MTAQVTAIPGGSEVLESGSVILARPGVRYQIADVDLVAGSIGAILAPTDMTFVLNEPSLGDLTVILPDGTLLVFVDMAALFGQGSGLADGEGGLVVASLEDVTEPAAGSEGGEAAEDGGSSAAVSDASISGLKDFGAVERGDFEPLGLGGLEQDDFSLGEDEADGNPILPAPIDLATILDPTVPIGPVIPTVDPPPLIIPSPGGRVLPCGCKRPTIRWAVQRTGDDDDNSLPGNEFQDVMTGGAGADRFVMNLADLGTSLFLADIITDFEDGVDRIVLNLNGAGPVTLGLAETNAGAGTGALDTVLVVQETGQILAVLQDVNAAGGATIDYNDIDILP